MWVATTDFPTPASHPFYTRLNQRLAEHHDFGIGTAGPAARHVPASVNERWLGCETDPGLSANRNVWSAAMSQAKNESDRMVCANVSVLCGPGFWRELQRAAANSGIGPLGTHAFRHTSRSWLDAVGTPIAVQQKLMRQSDIRTTMNIYGCLVTDEMEKASARVVGLALKPIN